MWRFLSEEPGLRLWKGKLERTVHSSVSDHQISVGPLQIVCKLQTLSCSLKHKLHGLFNELYACESMTSSLCSIIGHARPVSWSAARQLRHYQTVLDNRARPLKSAIRQKKVIILSFCNKKVRWSQVTTFAVGCELWSTLILWPVDKSGRRRGRYAFPASEREVRVIKKA